MTGAATPLSVTNRLRVTWDGLWLTAACLVFCSAAIGLIVRGDPVDVGIGLLALLIFGGGGLLAASRVLSRRPILVLDDAGVRLVAPWPRSSAEDTFLAWDDIVLIRACTQAVPHRRGTAGLHYLVFLVGEEADQPFRAPSPWEPRHAVRIRPTWDRSVEEVAAEARRYRPDIGFENRRLLRDASPPNR
ncbi:MAG: hypothetical protein M0026_10860 [Nocardiopsaceae bacterium]|nr:hypothetical protein [Nocardiopsaceae bacterium]